MSDGPCRYLGRSQPYEMKSFNSTPLCLACAGRLVYVGAGDWRHEDDPNSAALNKAQP